MHHDMDFRLVLILRRNCAVFDAVNREVETKSSRYRYPKGAREETVSHSWGHTELHVAHQRHHQVARCVKDLKSYGGINCHELSLIGWVCLVDGVSRIFLGFSGVPGTNPKGKTNSHNADGSCTSLMVELRGFEPLTSSMPWKRATNCAIAPGAASA